MLMASMASSFCFVLETRIGLRSDRYARGFELRRVNNSGDISWHKGRVFMSEVFRLEVLGFEQVEEGFYKVYFRDVEIGEFDVEAKVKRIGPTSSRRMNSCKRC
jgi:hypothetical protein